MSLRKTYFISISKDAHWATQDDNIAAQQAKEIARQYGGCEMVVLNETGGGHITVYGPSGEIRGMKPLKEVEL